MLRDSQNPKHNPKHNEEKQILSVSSLARNARVLLEQKFSNVWVEGEISNFARPRSGHWYFTLKDSNAQIRCAMFANRNRATKAPVREGLQVMIRGRVSLYEGRGDFQIIVDHLEPAGEGALRAAFEALKTKLANQGLFESERKRPLPDFPRHIAIITSSTGAALRDVLNVIARRYPALQVTLLPVTVQGPSAESDILAAFAQLPQLHQQQSIDAVLLTRGGGSLEDLWTFNLESLARVVADCPWPVVSAIGHQTDFAITDFVADLRAPTPSAAAELLTAESEELSGRIATQQARLTRSMSHALQAQRQKLRHLRARMVDPHSRLRQQQQRCDELEQRLNRALAQQQRSAQQQLATLQHRLNQASPAIALNGIRQRLATQQQRLAAATQVGLQQKMQQLQNRVRTLDALNPLQTLQRGFAVLTQNGQAIEQMDQVAVGAELKAYVQDGALGVRVVSQHPGEQLLSPTPKSPRTNST